MATDFKPGCVRPVSSIPNVEAKNVNSAEIKKEVVPMIKVGAPAPNFELPAYHKGEFKSYSLSDFKGKWVVLCFYPGDFTFV